VQPENNHETPVHGMRMLPKYGLSMEKVLELSLRNYEKNGISDRGVPWINHQDALASDDNASQISLPVCKSDQLRR